jgi:MFS family permease
VRDQSKGRALQRGSDPVNSDRVGLPGKRKTMGLLATILASSIAYIDESVVNIAPPAIERDLTASVVVIQWLVNAYTLCLSALLLIGDAAADQFGRRRVFIVGVSIFARRQAATRAAQSI